MKTDTRHAPEADEFVRALWGLPGADGGQAGSHLQTGSEDRVLGVRMGDVFALAKAYQAMELDQIETLLESPIHQARVGAVSIMDFQARRKRTAETRRADLYELYLRRHDRIDGWDLVDRAAPHVIGGHLLDKPRDPLYALARTGTTWERRTAIVATWAFIRRDELGDTFALAEIMVDDPEHFVQTAVGSWLREAGRRDPSRLMTFLDLYAERMPRVALRFAVERLDAETRAHYRSLKPTEPEESDEFLHGRRLNGR